MKVLLIGGQGYIGTSVADKLVKNGHEVDIVDIKSGADKRSITDASNYGVVVDLASLTLGGSAADPDLAMEVNYRSAVKIAKTSKWFIFPSTCSNYGVKTDGYATEGDVLHPISVYSQTKVAAEKKLISMPNTTIFRFATAFGCNVRGYYRPDLLLHDFIHAAKRGKIELFDGSFYRPMCHVDDLARVVVQAVEQRPTGVFNIGKTEMNFTKRELAEKVKTYVDCDIVEMRDSKDPRNYKVSFEKAKEVLGFVPERSIEQGITECLSALM